MTNEIKHNIHPSFEKTGFFSNIKKNVNKRRFEIYDSPESIFAPFPGYRSLTEFFFQVDGRYQILSRIERLHEIIKRGKRENLLFTTSIHLEVIKRNKNYLLEHYDDLRTEDKHFLKYIFSLDLIYKLDKGEVLQNNDEKNLDVYLKAFLSLDLTIGLADFIISNYREGSSSNILYLLKCRLLKALRKILNKKVFQLDFNHLIKSIIQTRSYHSFPEEEGSSVSRIIINNAVLSNMINLFNTLCYVRNRKKYTSIAC